VFQAIHPFDTLILKRCEQTGQNDILVIEICVIKNKKMCMVSSPEICLRRSVGCERQVSLACVSSQAGT
jgi:hypothetical protein